MMLELGFSVDAGEIPFALTMSVATKGASVKSNAMREVISNQVPLLGYNLSGQLLVTEIGISRKVHSRSSDKEAWRGFCLAFFAGGEEPQYWQTCCG